MVCVVSGVCVCGSVHGGHMNGGVMYIVPVYIDVCIAILTRIGCFDEVNMMW